METIVHDQTHIINNGNLRGSPMIAYTGDFSSSNSYRVGDVVLFQQILYLTIMDVSGALTPLANPNFIPYDFNTGILFTTNTSFILNPGVYDIVMQGGGGGGGTPNMVNFAGGGGGSAGFVGKFVFQVYPTSSPITLNATIGIGAGPDGIGTNTRVDYFNSSNPISSLYALGGAGGIFTGNGGDGGYGGGGGQVFTTPNSTGGSSELNISTAQPGTVLSNGMGSFSDASTAPASYTGLKGGTGGGPGSGAGGYFVGTTPFPGGSALQNSGAGGGGGGTNGSLFSPGGSGASGWIFLQRRDL